MSPQPNSHKQPDTATATAAHGCGSDSDDDGPEQLSDLLPPAGSSNLVIANTNIACSSVLKVAILAGTKVLFCSVRHVTHIAGVVRQIKQCSEYLMSCDCCKCCVT
jgi:hypothetical protein